MHAECGQRLINTNHYIHTHDIQCTVAAVANRLRRTQHWLVMNGVKLQPLTYKQSARVCTPSARTQQPDETYDDHKCNACRNSYLNDTTASAVRPAVPRQRRRLHAIQTLLTRQSAQVMYARM